jgi:hypothetical protein
MVTLMAYKIEAAERVYRIVVGLMAIAIGLFIFFPLGMWWGIVVVMLGIIPLASGLLGSCPTIPLVGLNY